MEKKGQKSPVSVSLLAGTRDPLLGPLCRLLDRFALPWRLTHDLYRFTAELCTPSDAMASDMIILRLPLPGPQTLRLMEFIGLSRVHSALWITDPGRSPQSEYLIQALKAGIHTLNGLTELENHLKHLHQNHDVNSSGKTRSASGAEVPAGDQTLLRRDMTLTPEEMQALLGTGS